MFQTLFKHIIYEYCINLAFDSIKKNFPSGQSMFYKGQQFIALEFEIDDIWWGIEDVEVIHSDNELLVLSYSTGEVHIPDNHIDMTQFSSDSTWHNADSYGRETDDMTVIFTNNFGGTQIFAIDELKEIDYV